MDVKQILGLLLLPVHCVPVAAQAAERMATGK
jgi:hypothetical protein